MPPRSIALLLAAAVLAGPPAAAQVGLNGITAGLGTITLGPVNTDALNQGNGQLGVLYYPPQGYFYVSRRGTLATTVAPHSMIVVNQSGALVTSFQIGTGLSGGAWGHRDGCTDAYAGGTNSFWGDELGIHCYDHTTMPPTYVTGFHTILAANGPQIVNFPFLVGFAPFPRALEYNPNGNGGNGSFWVANFGSTLYEVDLNGTILNQFPVTTNTPAWSAYGLAMNLKTGMLWVNSSPAGSATALAAIAEIDPSTGVFTGRRFNPPGTLGAGTSPWVYAAQGGLSYIEGRTGPTYGPATTPPFSELVALTQGTPDYFSVHRLDLYGNFDSALETRLEASVNNSPYTMLPQSFGPGSLVSFQYMTPAGNPGSPVICIGNISPAPSPLGSMLGIPEYTILNNVFSTPTAISAGVTAATVGDGFGLMGLAAPDLIFLPPATQPLLPTPGILFPSLGGPGTVVSFQALYLAPTGQTVATNRLVLTEI